MWFIGLECRRQYVRLQARCPIEELTERSVPKQGVANPAELAEKQDTVAKVRRLAATLPPDERDAVARGFETLAHLDSGAIIRNEAVKRYRGLERLRALMMESESRVIAKPAVD